MITHKHITKIVTVIVAIAVFCCVAAMFLAEELTEVFGGTGVAVEYETELFDTSETMTVNIIMDEADWEEMLSNATSEEYYKCDVEINGEMFYSVGLRPKGNTSLTSIANDPDTDRYSFKLEFDQYVDGQTCYGLDKLVLNNNYADATNMKEALVYDMYQYLGADASLYNYSELSVNGEYWGVYLALEAVEDSFMLRNYGAEDGELYKPEGVNVGGGAQGNADSASDSGGADLNYIDDDTDSYSTIWEGEVTSTNDSDHERVVEALKNISEGNDLEEYMDVDNLLKYMAVHAFVVNDDSFTGMMAHNYYLYEADGQLNLIPWDYNLAFGGMGNMGGMNTGEGATGVVNDAIDDAFSGTEFFNTLLENEEYKAQYYSYLQQLAQEYVFGGEFYEFYSSTRSQIDSLVETDPTAFYSYDEYNEAAETLYEVVQLRAQSVSGQVSGTIPATQSEQNDSDALIDASHIDISVMGVNDMGGGEDTNAQMDGNTTMDTSEAETLSLTNMLLDSTVQSSEVDAAQDESTTEDTTQVNGEPPAMPDGEMPEGFDASQFGGTPPDGAEIPENSESVAEDGTAGEGNAENPDMSEMPQMNGAPQMGGDAQMGGAAQDSSTNIKDNLILYGICFVIMLAALIFAKIYRRRPVKR